MSAEQPSLTWRVATVTPDAPHQEDERGLRRVLWTLRRPVFPRREEAPAFAETTMEEGCRNAIILEQHGGRVQVPRWLRTRAACVREEEA